ncbi:MAG: hypothetical protein Q7S41_01890 [Candidatus Limnocylindria bacterium]|nr:hypothetical protein [Candidatus Limnocylindria bacterium]
MFIGIVVAVSVLAVVVLLVVLFLQRGREAIDTSPRSLLRAYLYAASFAGLVALIFGLSSLLNWGIAQAAGYDVVYGGAGGSPRPALVKACPPGVTGCVEPNLEEIQRQQEEQQRRQLGEELLRGITFTVFGAIFYGAHYAARRGVVGPDEARSGLRRAYLILGTAVFGLATIVLVPTGLYQLLANAILDTPENLYRPGIADSFAPGVVSLVVWLVFLRLIVAETRGSRDAA